MALTVTVAATESRLCLLDRVMDDLAITDESQKPKLLDVINRASDAVRTYTNEFFAKQTYSETVPGYGEQTLMLSRTPIRSVISVTHRGDAITDFVIDDADAGLLRRDLGWAWELTARMPLGGLDFYPAPDGELDKFTVVYPAGYDLPDEEAEEVAANLMLPGDIEQAAMDTVKAWWLRRLRSSAVKSKKVGSLSITYGTEDENLKAFALPPSAIALLQPWRRAHNRWG